MSALYAGGRPVTVMDRIFDPVLRRKYSERVGRSQTDGRGLVARDSARVALTVPSPWVARTPDGTVRWFPTWDEAYAFARTGVRTAALRTAPSGDSVEGPRLAVDPMREAAAWRRVVELAQDWADALPRDSVTGGKRERCRHGQDADRCWVLNCDGT